MTFDHPDDVRRYKEIRDAISESKLVIGCGVADVIIEIIARQATGEITACVNPSCSKEIFFLCVDLNSESTCSFLNLNIFRNQWFLCSTCMNDEHLVDEMNNKLCARLKKEFQMRKQTKSQATSQHRTHDGIEKSKYIRSSKISKDANWQTKFIKSMRMQRRKRIKK